MNSFQTELIQRAIQFDQILNPSIQSTPDIPQYRKLDILINILGYITGIVLFKISSVSFANSIVEKIAISKTSPAPAPLELSGKKNLLCTKKFLQEHHLKPNILFLSSHPDPSPEQTPYLGSLVYHSLRIAYELNPQSRFKLTQAIDSYALDTLPYFLKHFYSGLIASGQLGVDRLPDERSPFQKIVFSQTHYRLSILRMIRYLRQGKSVFMALGGAVRHNSKIFYTCREFAQRVFKISKTKKSKRWVESTVLDILVRNVQSACFTGELSVNEKNQLEKLMNENGCDLKQGNQLIEEFKNELKLDTPYRERFFKIILERMKKYPVSLLLLPMFHNSQGKIFLKAPILIFPHNKKNGMVCYRSAPDWVERTATIAHFARDFVSTRYQDSNLESQ